MQFVSTSRMIINSWELLLSILLVKLALIFRAEVGSSYIQQMDLRINRCNLIPSKISRSDIKPF